MTSSATTQTLRPRGGGLAVEDGSKLIASVERALDVLLLFVRDDRPDLGVTEISRELGLSKAVVHRLLMTLASRGLIEADIATRRYRLGPAALTVGAAYLERIDLNDMVVPHLRELSRVTDETATMSIRHGWHRVYVAQITPEREVRMEVALGRPFPLHAGGSSKAFLAHLSDDEREAYLAQPDLEAMTPETLVDANRLRGELAAVRSRGYATSLGERQNGAASVAAPIIDRNGQPVAVISICGPVERFGPVVESTAELLLASTRRLSRALGRS